ncbi:hypothetical protein OHA40_16055 [Nocardia sp. NBC_00508]|uniref:hypothetical protein n=1 Tax=Nocardia sp. NBC_00508 TaxID=2975992 RepID=UPI002E7FF36F|nr:hypothetical protein [Nocardia sp. NBC_00508]WUD69498.1 hypothetical protein OHA40_16055 [Nocardia sp. NBC_00508]
MSPHPIAGRLRGGLVGALVATLAVAAHGAAGGGIPDSTELTLLLLIATVMGSAAGAVPVRPGPVVLGLLGAGQLASHAALSGPLGHDHTGRGTGGATTLSILPAGWMLFAHAVATLGCAVLIVLAERLHAVASGALRAILARPRTSRIVGAPQWPDPGLPPYRCAPNGAIGPRAPPVPA